MKYSELPKWLQNIALLRKDHHIELSEDNHLTSLFVFGNTPEGATFWRNISSNKLPDPSTYVKVGDWVQITKSDILWCDEKDRFVGRVFQVTSINSDGYIRFKGGDEYNWKVDLGHFVKANPPANQSISPTEESKELKVGDKVRISKVGIDSKRLTEREDQIGAIEFIDTDNLPYKVRWDDGDYNWFRKDHIELVPKHPTTQFAETTIQLIQQSSFKSTNNEINFSRKTATISSGEECQETRLCSKPKFTPTPSRY